MSYYIEKSIKFPLQGKLKIQGLTISVENRKGSIRRGEDVDGKKWATTMLYPYGYILGVLGWDKDHLDCFVGDDHKSEIVFVVNQIDPFNKNKFDEHKVMFGFSNKEDAKKAYLKHYDSPKFFGSMSCYTMEDFKKLIGFKEKGVKRVTEKTFEKGFIMEYFINELYIDLEKSHVKEYQRKTKTGQMVTVKEHEDKRSKKMEEEKGKRKVAPPGEGFSSIPKKEINILYKLLQKNKKDLFNKLVNKMRDKYNTSTDKIKAMVKKRHSDANADHFSDVTKKDDGIDNEKEKTINYIKEQEQDKYKEKQEKQKKKEGKALEKKVKASERKKEKPDMQKHYDEVGKMGKENDIKKLGKELQSLKKMDSNFNIEENDRRKQIFISHSYSQFEAMIGESMEPGNDGIQISVNKLSGGDIDEHSNDHYKNVEDAMKYIKKLYQVGSR